jgi:hypothetical protein
VDVRLEETVYLDFVTSASTGAAADADSTPTAAVYEDATDTAVLSPTVTKRTSLTGNYRVPVACTTANGFEANKSYNVIASATVGGINAKAVVGRFVLRPAAAVANVTQWAGTAVATPTTAGVPEVDVTFYAGTAASLSDGTATAGAASTITLGTGVTYGTDLLKGRTITLQGGTGAGQSRFITGNTNATPSVVTVHRAWDTNPSTDTTYTLDPTAEADVRQWGAAAVTGMPMPTYSQPTGFLAATFPLTIASTTNITAATGVVLSGVTHTGAVIPTVTNLTNAAGAGDFTATMKASIGTAVAASAVASVTAGVTVSTNNDKTGYSLTQSFPSNFASLGINSSGHVLRTVLTDTTSALSVLPVISANWLTAAGLAADAAAEIAVAVRDVDNTSPAASSLGAVVNASAAGGLDPQEVADLVVSGIGTVDANVVTMAPDTLTASALAASAVTEIQSGLATAAALATAAGYIDTEIGTIITAVGTSIPATLSTIAGYLDTEVAAIKLKTDLLTTFPSNFSSLSITSGGVVAADIKAVRGVTLTGTGVEGDEWVPA